MNPEYPKHPKIYDLCMDLASSSKTQYEKACWIHLSDAVENGTITPMEAYQTIKLGYLAENLKVRNSKYSRML